MRMTIAAAMAVFVCATSSQAAFVASEDVYGIINTPVLAGMNAVGVSLLPMAGDNQAVSVQDVILTAGLTGGDSTTGDKLQVYNAASSTYSTYWLDSETMKWVDSNGNSPAAAVGDGMWIKASAAATVYQVGVMSGNAEEFVDVASGNNFIANPYPAPLALNGGPIAWDATMVAENKTSSKTADLIRAWTGTRYDTYYYYSYTGYPELTGWYLGNTKTTYEVPAGEGFWFYRRGTALTAPLTVDMPY